MNNKGFESDTQYVGSLENEKSANVAVHQNEKQISNGTMNLENGDSTTITENSEPEREGWGKGNNLEIN